MFTNLYDIVNHIQTACSEMGYCEYTQEDYKKQIKAARRRGVRDIGGWLGDELYNDAGLINDLAGDSLYDYIYKLGEDPQDDEVFNRHMSELNKMMPHVTLTLR